MKVSINRKTEPIEVADSDGNVVLHWDVPTDDASVQRMTVLLANAISHAAELSAASEDESDPEAAARSREDLAALQKRVINAVLGDGAYDEVLAYMGDGTPVDPMENMSNLGELFAALCVWVHDHCTNAGLRGAAEYLVPDKPRRKGRKRK